MPQVLNIQGKLLKIRYVWSAYDLKWSLNSFSSFDQYFLWVFGKSFRNNAPPTILSSYHPGISSNITNATHLSTPPTTLFTLAYHPRNPRLHLTHASTPATPPTLARIACHFSNSIFFLFPFFHFPSFYF